MLKPSPLFRRFLVSYLVILLIPSLAGYMSYRTSISVATSVSIENGISQLRSSQQLLERRMAEVEGFTRQLAINENLNQLMNEYATGGKTNVFGIWKSMQEVTTFGQTNDFLRHYFIYLRNYNVVLTPGSAYVRPEHYYENYHYRNMAFTEWKREIIGKTHQREMLPLHPFVSAGAGSTVMTYMQSLPLDSFSESSPAVVVVLIDQKTVSSLFSGITRSYGGWVRVGDSQGRTLSLQGSGAPDIPSLNRDPRFNPAKVTQHYKDDLVITIQSEKNGWVYQAGIPESALLEKANRIKAITWMFTGAALPIGLIAGLVLAYRDSAPIARLLGVFGQEGRQGRNAYDFLQGNIAEMITSNRKLEAELRRQQPLVRDAFYKRLIAGELQTREEISAAAIQADASLTGNAGYVALVKINGYSGMDNVEVLNELNAARLVLKQAVLEREGPVQMTDLGADKIVLLYLTEEGRENELTEERVHQGLHRLADEIFQEYKISVLAAVGGRFEALTEISHVYELAKQTLDHAVQTGSKTVVWYGESALDSATYYYPLDVELRLIGTLRAGELEEARRFIQTILQQNMEARELSAEMRGQLGLEIKGTFLKLLEQKTFAEADAFEQVKSRIIGLQPPESMETFRMEIDGIMAMLCGMVASKKNELHVRTVEKMKQFIMEHYTDTELTLYRVAEHVERPEKYVSQLFKDVTGTNMSDYLEQVRMNQAASLLKANSYTIDEISSMVGYNSSHSFRRAFKRVTGVSPSTYRQSMEA
ncbi:AraC family transcriptional regulator [Paenibacillus gansuensis]|uniref:AraC family transcriptional regulator n=1 Tax=Paenibacillus gansuensis TaxID=306542 RepID=A0ABW5PAA0_9BACL